MKRVEKRKQRLTEGLREYVKARGGADIGLDLSSVPPEIRKLVEEAIREPEDRMRRTMKDVAEVLHLRWSDEFQTDHPYGAQLDGQIFDGAKRVAVVELLAKNDKQNRGDLLDLLAHRERNKILVLGCSAKCDPLKAVAHIRGVLGLLAPLVGKSSVAVFTEDKLKQNPGILGPFLELP